jgi:hypothetical protein
MAGQALPRKTEVGIEKGFAMGRTLLLQLRDAYLLVLL